MSINQFNIRVYALIINENNEILLCDEYHYDKKMTKFPGGGLNFGEGTIDCLKREAKEEFGQEIEIIKHFYTTHFFQKALFHEDHQLISIYYLARFLEPTKFKISTFPHDFELKNGSFSFRWKKLQELTKDDVTFPIDRHVVGLINEVFYC